MTERRPRLAVAIGLMALGLCLLTTRGSLGGGQDEELPFLVTQSLWRTHHLALDEPTMAYVRTHVSQWTDAVREGRDGRYWSVFGPAQSLAALPLYTLASVVTAGQPETVARATLVRWCCALNPLLTGLTAALLAWWLMLLAPERPRRAALAGLLAVLATPLWPYAKTFMAEPLSALCFLAAAFAAGRAGHGRRVLCWAWCGGLALALAMLNRPHNLILWPALGLLAGWPRDPRRHLAFGAAPAATALWWLWFNTQRFGRPLDFGYLAAIQGDFSLSFLPVGVVGQMLSPGRGLLWYAPLAVLVAWAWPRRCSPPCRPPAIGRTDTKAPSPLAGRVGVGAAADHPTSLLLLAACLTPLLFYGARSNWWGSWCWGPRYLVPILPLLAVLAARGAERAPRWLVRVVVAWGVAAALAGLVTYNGLYQDFVWQRDGSFARLLWRPLDSPLVGHWLMLGRAPVDLMCWQLLRVDPVLGAAHGILRAAPAMAGWWLWRRRDEVTGN
ncbi:MAG: hypothetical protein HZB16_01845 [Armatimonadetes bacterium]|nr:hypothetical protein [Armatimonadota bacterium]